MGLAVAVEDEAGELIEMVEDPTNVLHRVLPGPDDSSFSVLGVIDWYGDTVFNRLQVPAFLIEWSRVTERCTHLSADEIALLGNIERLARLALSLPHLYLKFYGD
jgi:hypothetical protein